jgi:hypothetical protein
MYFVEDAGFGQRIGAIQQVFVQQTDEVGIVAVKGPDLPDRG